jgi:hypothetical protein
VNAQANQGFIDWEWLGAQQAVEEMTYTRHIRCEKPITVKMNGHKNKGIILKPEA